MIRTKKNYDEENVYSILNHYDVIDLSSNSIVAQVNLDKIDTLYEKRVQEN